VAAVSPAAVSWLVAAASVPAAACLSPAFHWPMATAAVSWAQLSVEA
jgi:hypothetical protein